MRKLCAVLVAGAGCAMAGAQTYTLEARLIVDGAAGSPGGPTPALTFPFTFPNTTATRLGFWLQARVAVTGAPNWGVMRGGGDAFIQMTNTIGWPSTVQFAPVNAAQTQFGSGRGYRAGDSQGTISADRRRLSSFDAFTGATRTDTDADLDGDLDDDGDGLPENPWGVNGSSFPAYLSGGPIPGNGTFSPWASVYRFYMDLDTSGPGFPFADEHYSLIAGLTITAAAGVRDDGNGVFTMLPGPSQHFDLESSYTYVPSPGASTLLALGALAVLGRRR